MICANLPKSWLSYNINSRKPGWMRKLPVVFLSQQTSLKSRLVRYGCWTQAFSLEMNTVLTPTIDQILMF